MQILREELQPSRGWFEWDVEILRELHHLLQGTGSSSKEVAEAMDWPDRKATRILNGLRTSGWIDLNKRRWSITEHAPKV